MKYIKIIFKQLYISKDFLKKLNHNFHEFTILEKIIYFIFIRWFISGEKRFFFEGSLLVPGQMYIEDRKALYDIVIKNKPNYCFEVGTYTGGGSTYFLASAFHKIGSGKVVTMENDKELYDRAVNFYKKRLKHLLPHVEFIYGKNINDFKDFLSEPVECVFLDGAEDERQTKEQYLNFFNYLGKNAIIMCHDWNTEKTKLLKPILNNNEEWRKITELSEPQSIGFAAFKRNEQ